MNHDLKKYFIIAGEPSGDLHGSKLIKASGGVKSKQIALDLINAGANRIGTSSGVEIIK